MMNMLRTKHKIDYITFLKLKVRPGHSCFSIPQNSDNTKFIIFCMFANISYRFTDNL